MKYLIVCVFPALLSVVSCTNRRTATSQPVDTTGASAAIQRSLPDSIEQAIGLYDRRLDVKMRRKVYALRPGSLVTLQKWFENGDTTRPVKIREEMITGDTKMEVIQYHYLNQELAEIHDYRYDKQCDGNQKQCIQEAKYFFKDGRFDSAVRRESVGTNDSVPVVERAAFQPFEPAKMLLAAQKVKLGRINEKYASLPYKTLAKPR